MSDEEKNGGDVLFHTEDTPSQTAASAPKAAHKEIMPRALSRALSTLLCVFIFLLCAVLLLLVSCRGIVTPGALQQIVAEADYTSIEVGGFIGEKEIVIPAGYGSADEVVITGSDTVSDVISKLVSQYTDVSISKSDIQRFIKESTIESFIANKLASYASLITDDSESATTTGKELIELVKQNEDVIYNAIGCRISEQNYAEIENALDEYNIERELTVTKEQAQTLITESLAIDDATLSYITLALSERTVWLLVAVIILLAGLIFICRSFSFGSTMQYAGVAAAVNGALYTVVIAVFSAKGWLQAREIAAELDISLAEPQVVQSIIDTLAGRFLITGIIALIVGVALFITGYSLVKLKR